MKKEIKTLFNNLAPIRARFLRQAHYQDEDLEIVYKKQTMTVPKSVLRSAAVYKTIVKDKFGKAPENMYYYNWIPDDSPTTESLFNKD